ncbi:hypothetical protein ACMYR3_06815 [Ampullimonas aquatilis]|uniref:hypothetical protein n=1 Tax=Ampullimonas aquatilis TaxID=1341549 RepID=UPI003C727579
MGWRTYQLDTGGITGLTGWVMMLQAGIGLFLALIFPLVKSREAKPKVVVDAPLTPFGHAKHFLVLLIAFLLSLSCFWALGKALLEGYFVGNKYAGIVYFAKQPGSFILRAVFIAAVGGLLGWLSIPGLLAYVRKDAKSEDTKEF